MFEGVNPVYGSDGVDGVDVGICDNKFPNTVSESNSSIIGSSVLGVDISRD